MQSCFEVIEWDEVYPPYYPPYFLGNKTIFSDYEGSGLYLIDTRRASKYLLFHYSSNSNKWSAISKGEELFSSSEYINIYRTLNAMQLENHEILAFIDFAGTVTYSPESNHWEPKSYMPIIYNGTPYSFFGGSYIVPNRFKNQAYIIEYNSLYMLDDSYLWSYECDVDTSLQFAEFISADTLLYFDGIVENKNNPIVKLNITDHTSTISYLDTRDTINFPKNALYLTRGGSSFSLLYPAYDNITHELTSYRTLYGQNPLQICIVDFSLNSVTPVKPFEYDENTFINPLDYNNLGNPNPYFNYRVFADSVSLYGWSHFFLKNDLFLFRNDIGFRYSFDNQQWEKLPYLDYKTFNKQ
jgi:hypothetical protein